MTVAAASDSFELRSDLASRTYLPRLSMMSSASAKTYTSTPPRDFPPALRTVSGGGGAFLCFFVLGLQEPGPAG
jgi:hypothetical protein